MADYKQLCVELLSELENAIGVIYGEDGTRHISSADAVITKAHAALAEPEPEGPTDEELERWYSDCADETTMGSAEHYWAFEVPIDYANDLARAVLARWGK